MMPRKQPSLHSKESACLASFRFRCWNRSSLFLGYLGWGLGEPYHAIAKGIDKVESIVSLLLLGLIFALILWLRSKVRGKILKSD
jgi:hypothetical protein